MMKGIVVGNAEEWIFLGGQGKVKTGVVFGNKTRESMNERQSKRYCLFLLRFG